MRIAFWRRPDAPRDEDDDSRVDAETKDLTERAERAAAELREHVRDNHFAARFAAALRS